MLSKLYYEPVKNMCLRELGAGEGFSPADPVPPVERVEAEEDVLV